MKFRFLIFLIVFVACYSALAASDVNSANRVMDADDYVAAGAMKFVGWIGKFHPPATHFPIALIIAALVAEILFNWTSNVLFDGARKFCLWFGTIAALITGTLGWCFGGFELKDENWLLTTHRWLGTSTVLCCIILAILAWQMYYRQKVSWRSWYRLMLIVAAVLVSVTGFFGGAMLYGLNEFAW